VLAVTLLAQADTDAATALLAAVVADGTRCAVAVADGDASWKPPTPPVVATPAADGDWLLGGTVWGLSTPAQPDTVLTVAATDDGPAIFAVPADHVEVMHADELDAARGMIEVGLSQAPARLLFAGVAAAEAIGAAYRRGLLAIGAEQLGVARACLEAAVGYAKTRTQFGSPIGSFQAIKHRCSEVLLDVELAEAMLDQAVGCETHVDAELAFIVASRAALSAAESCIHIHGGIGFTWEHSAHRYLRRARVNATLLGPPAGHRDAVAASACRTPAEGIGE
jgi:alkylation response protein AidB-like acyl-CoA dehydrogenase